MNNRMQDLIYEAEEYADNVENEDDINFHLEYTKKLIQLIVLECSIVASKHVLYSPWDGDVGDAIFDHFGMTL
jgi:hypothetical protein